MLNTLFGAGLDGPEYWGWGPNAYIGNYGDNSLLYFHQYQNAAPGSPLYEGALTGTDIESLPGSNPQVASHLVDQFRADVMANRLPRISYVVAPEAYTEHGNWPPNYGAWYISQFLDALTANPEVWSKTALFLTYDENDGFFDHVVPQTPPMDRSQGISTVPTTHEIFPGDASFAAGPIGLGVRVPMIVISPWSKGGYVSSELFDHTSLIKFMEARFAEDNPGLIETNITPWRRAVAGDLTSAFDFRRPNNRVVALPSTAACVPPNQDRYPDYVPPVPSTQTMPSQEPGTRPARPVPYELYVDGSVNVADGSFTISYRCAGKTAVFQTRSGNSDIGPWTYTVASGQGAADTYPVTSAGLSGYELSVFGPNGFFRAFRGSLNGSATVRIGVHTTYHKERNAVTLALANHASHSTELTVMSVYSGRSANVQLPAGHRSEATYELHPTFGWYDFVVTAELDSTFRYQLAGHVETGEESRTDPAIGFH